MTPEEFGYVMDDHFKSLSPSDHDLWMKLFYLADKYVGKDLCDRLQYIRAGGCHLEPHPQYGYVIRPIIGPIGWASKHQYEQERKCLNPYKEKLVRLLKRLATERIRLFD